MEQWLSFQNGIQVINMNFMDFVDNNKLNLVNDLNSISRNLTTIFNLKNTRDKTERFTLEINGLSGIYGKIFNGKIRISVVGLDEPRIGHDVEATKKNIEKTIVPFIKSKITESSIRDQYNIPSIEIEFDKLNNDAVSDIMFLVSKTRAELRPNSFKQF